MSKLRRNFFATLLCLVLLMAFAVAFVGCDEAESGSEVTEEQWNAALSEETLKNVTIKFSGTVDAQTIAEDNITMQQDQTLKFANGRVQIIIIADGKTIANDIGEGKGAQQQADIYLQILSVLLEQRESFTFDESQKAYYFEGPVMTTINGEGVPGDKTFDVTMKDSYVRFDDQGRPEYFKCDFTQASDNATAHTDGTWTFSDYGTTVIDK